MLNLSKTDIAELKELQPELIVIGNKISGCFYLSATLGKKSKGRSEKLNHYAWNYKSKDSKYIHDHFYIDITLGDNLYPTKVCETSNKLLSWKNKIPSEYWHVNTDNSLCLGKKPDMLEMQKQYSFAKFINILLMQYFYCMSYANKYKKEPWVAYRHGLFALLEIVCNSANIQNVSVFLDKIYECCNGEWNNLLRKTQKRKIKNHNFCPFCRNKRLAKNCTIHRKQIEGYNKVVTLLHQ